VEVFENHKRLRSDAISIAFQRPTDQKIIFVSRPNGLPALLGRMSEMTVTSPDQPGVALSIVKRAGTPKTLGRAYTAGPIRRRDILGGVIHDYHRQPSASVTGYG